MSCLLVSDTGFSLGKVHCCRSVIVADIRKKNRMKLLQGKKALIVGVLNEKSIAWNIARTFCEHGADLAITYQDEIRGRHVRSLAESLNSQIIMPCDVRSDVQIRSVIEQIQATWCGLDIVVHAVAFAEKGDLAGTILDTDRRGFTHALEVSVYSLINIVKEALPMMAGRNGAVLTLSYHGAVKVFPHYNVMGIAKAALEASVRYLAEAVGDKGVRVNAISSGPILTTSSFGLSGFSTIAACVGEKAPLRRNVTQEDVASSALYLCSGLASGVSGEVHYVDAGYNVLGV